MTRQVNQARQDAWRQRIQRQRESGQTIAEFCRTEGVSLASFHAWKRKLRVDRARKLPPAAGRKTPPASRRAAAGKRGPAARGPGRLETLARGTGGFLELPVRAVASSPWVEVALADGTIVRVPQQNTAALVAVLRVLRGESLGWSNSESRHA
jgi:hypothetical protein